MNNFDLKTYAAQIVSMAELNKLSAAEAVEHFVINLNTMNDYYSCPGGLNFRAMGQQWNALSYKIRNAQKTETIAMVKKRMLPSTPATKSKRGL